MGYFLVWGWGFWEPFWVSCSILFLGGHDAYTRVDINIFLVSLLSLLGGYPCFGVGDSQPYLRLTKDGYRAGMRHSFLVLPCHGELSMKGRWGSSAWTMLACRVAW